MTSLAMHSNILHGMELWLIGLKFEDLAGEPFLRRGDSTVLRESMIGLDVDFDKPLGKNDYSVISFRII